MNKWARIRPFLALNIAGGMSFVFLCLGCKTVVVEKDYKFVSACEHRIDFPLMPSTQFTKPSAKAEYQNALEAFQEAAEPSPNMIAGYRAAIGGRKSAVGIRALWLDATERFVLDGVVEYWGGPDVVMDVVLLVDFKPAEFALVEVDYGKPFPAITDSSTQEMSFARHGSLFVRDSTPTAFSLVAQTSAFGESRAYDVRFVTMSYRQQTKNSLAHIVRWGPSSAFTVYHGGVRFGEQEIPQIKSLGLTSIGGAAKTLLDYPGGLALSAPNDPMSISTLTQAEAFEGGNLVAAYDGNGAVYNFRAAANGFCSEKEENVFLVAFMGTDILPEPHGLLSVAPHESDGGVGTTVTQFEFSASVDREGDEPAYLTLIGFQNPFEAVEDVEAGLLSSFDTTFSNGILFGVSGTP